MQASMARPADPTHIAYPGTPNEKWWNPAAQQWVEPAIAPPSLDRLIKAFSAIRDARAARKRAFEEKDAELEGDQTKLRAVILDLMNQSGAKSVATEQGTAYRTEKVKASAADWRTIYDWIAQEPERFELLEKRLKPTFVKEFMDQNDGQVPPGVNVHREYEVSIRRPTAPTK